MSQNRCIGTSVKRKEDPRLLCGSSHYVDDIQLRGQLYGAFVRSPYGHARIKSVNVSKALETEGVVSVFTGQDLKNTPMFVPNTLRLMSFPLLAYDKVRYFGEPVAFVAATSRSVAEDAVEAVEVEYEVLTPVVDPERAILKDSPLVHDDWGDNIMEKKNYNFGDVASAFRSADTIVKERFVVNRVTGTPIEPRGIVANFNKIDGELNVWVSTQFSHAYRSLVALILGYPENKIRVIVPEVGGGFGVKLVYPDEIVVVYSAMQLGKPVKWIETRSEHLSVTNHARGQIHEIEAAFDSKGSILGIKDVLTADMGAYWSVVGWDPVRFTMDFIPGPYRVKNYSIDINCVATNKVFYAAYRGFGMIVGNFVIERVFDIAAKKLGIDPAEIRDRNLIKSDEFPYTTVTGLYYDRNSFAECLQDVVVKSDYENLRKWQEQERRKGRCIGIGMSIQVECSAPSEEATVGLAGFEAATIKIDPTGYVTVYTGLCPQGQGTETTLAQIVSDELTVPVENVTVIHGDSSQGPYGMGTWGSRGAVAGGAAVLGASKSIQKKILSIGAGVLEADVDDLEIGDYRVRVKGASDRFIGIRDIAAMSYYTPHLLPAGTDPTLEATYYFNLPNIKHPNEKGEANLNTNYSNAAHLVVVELDQETGKVKILKYFVAHDCGIVINPVIVEGQIVGGTVAGLGNALLEEIKYDADGNHLTDNFLNYLIPTSLDAPEITVQHRSTPSTTVPGGFKGCGEGGAISAPAAIFNSINDALSGKGIKLNTTPAKPEAVWNSLRA